MISEHEKTCIILSMLLSTGSLMAQSTVETVYLKNGGLVKGEIIEQVPGQSLKVRTKDGNIFVYQMDEVERITKEESPVNNKGHRGLDFNIDLGYNVPTKSGGDGNLSAELSLGKRFSRSFYWGLGAGVYIPTGGGNVQIPITTEAKMFFPLKSKLTPFVSLKGGYIINTASDIHQYIGKKTSIDIKKSNYVLLQRLKDKCQAKNIETMNQNEEDFERQVRAQKATIYTVCYMFSRDQDEVADLYQECLINLWRSWANFEHRSDMRT